MCAAADLPFVELESFYEILYMPDNRASGRHASQSAPNQRARRLERPGRGERTAEMTVPAPMRVISMPRASVTLSATDS
jgi:hypothetical protein